MEMKLMCRYKEMYWIGNEEYRSVENETLQPFF